MKRISTDKEYLESGKVTVDADGISVEIGNLPTKQFVEETATGSGRYRGKVPANTNIDELTGTNSLGVWEVSTYVGGITGLPTEAAGVYLLQVDSSAAGVTAHTLIDFGRRAWFRTQSVSGQPWTWRPWVPFTHMDNRGTIPKNQDINQFYGDAVRGTWTVNTYVATPTNFPFVGTCTLEVEVAENGFTHQTAKAFGSGAILTRSQKALNAPTWTEWAGTGATQPSNTSVSTVMLKHTALVDQATARRGGTIGIDGKKAVALRFDHFLEPFRDTILPLLRERSLPWAQVVNADRIGSYTGDKVAWADLQSWAVDSGGEVWNHGSTHANATTASEVDYEVKSSLDKLKSNLPQLAIEGWAPPGTTAGGFMGHIPGATPEQWDTYGGAVIAGNHAFTSGGFGGQYRILDGKNRVGEGHAVMDAATTTTVDSTLNGIPPGMGCVLMLHPNAVGTTNQITVETLTYMLDELVRRRDAGELEMLTYSGMYLADSRSAYRHDLLGGASAGASWSTTLFLSRMPQFAGGMRELTAQVTSTAGGTITTTIGASTKTHTVPAGTTTIRHHAVIPQGATSLALAMSGQDSATGIKLQAV